MPRKYVKISVAEYEKLKREAADGVRLRGLLHQTGGSERELILAADHDPVNGLYAQMYSGDKKEKSGSR